MSRSGPPLLGEVTDQHHRRSIEFVSDNIEIAVVIKIDDDRRTRPARGPNRDILWSTGKTRQAIAGSQFKPGHR